MSCRWRVPHDHLARQMGSSLEGADSTRIGLAMVDLCAAIGEFATSDTSAITSPRAANSYSAPIRGSPPG